MKSRIRCLKLVVCAFSALFIIGGAVSSARDYYVDVYGSDSNSGLSPDQAWASFAYACESVEASADDPAVIYLSPHSHGMGSYQPYVPGQVYSSVSLPQWTSLKGCGPAKTFVNYYLGVEDGCEFRMESLSVVRLTVYGQGVADTAVTIQDCRLHDFRGCIRIETVRSGHQVHTSAKLYLAVVNCLFDSVNQKPGIGVSTPGMSVDIRITGTWFKGVRNVQPNKYDPAHPFLGSADCIDLCQVAEASEASESRLSISNSLFTCADLGAASRTNCVRGAFRGGGECAVAISNCLFVSSNNPNDGLFRLAVASDSTCSVAMEHCTSTTPIVFDSDVQDAPEITLDLSDCVLTHSEAGFVEGPLPEVFVRNTCADRQLPGIGNIAADPVFATGGLGGLYLSQLEAGQAETSPCVDAGSMLASESTVAGLTTRTDHLPDDGVLDMGFHYGRKIGPSPDLGIGTDGLPFSPGDEALVYVRLHSQGLMMLADAYLAIELEGQMRFFADANWVAEETPWMEGLSIWLCPDWYYLPLQIPESAPIGTYTLYLGLVDRFTGELEALASTELVVVSPE